MSVSNTNRWKLGLFVVVGVGLTIGSLMWLGVSQLQRRTTPAYFYFSESVNGLEVGSPVEFLGVELGRVEEIFPAPDRRHIEVRAGIYVDTLEAWGISPSSATNPVGDEGFVSDEIRGQLVRAALTSVAFIQLDVYDVDKHPEQRFSFPVPPETIYTVPSTFKSLEKGLTEGLAKLPGVFDRVSSVLKSLDEGLMVLDFSALNREALETLASAENMMNAVAKSPLVDQDSELMRSLTKSLDELSALTAQLRGPNGDVDRAVTSFTGAADAFREDFEGSDIPAAVAAVQAAGVGFEGTSSDLSLLIDSLRTSLAQLTVTLESVQSLSDVLIRDPGALLRGRTPRAPFNPK